MVVVRCLILCSKFAKNLLSAGLRPDRLGSLQRSPGFPSWMINNNNNTIQDNYYTCSITLNDL